MSIFCLNHLQQNFEYKTYDQMLQHLNLNLFYFSQDFISFLAEGDYQIVIHYYQKQNPIIPKLRLFHYFFALLDLKLF